MCGGEIVWAVSVVPQVRSGLKLLRGVTFRLRAYGTHWHGCAAPLALTPSMVRFPSSPRFQRGMAPS